ncbi:biotin-independent malonate decarboxylase subunit beta [Brevibacillus massiliensis]|uniref:biotin-independent malonate decarboxylase subunit beta n=1 Tax=Brevibacillus massiliensis TaxID=1118054 RepID=UPI0003074201|nr:biotin-independent malonate decarboxylase subunit beta [Brevibacillus massiliensis]
MKHRESFVELDARERARAVLDEGTFREILGPFDRMESPHLEPQGIVPQSDDGVVVARGKIGGVFAVVISIEGKFQGGGIGEVAGAKIAGALELALKDNENGVSTRPVLLFDTGGVRLQEANYGLLSIAEIQAAIVALRRHVPVVGVIPGKIGSFGGMSITAGLLSALIMTREGRLGLNGPEVIEQEAGIEEFDSADRQLIWNTIGGAQRVATGFADELAADDVTAIAEAIRAVFARGVRETPRSAQVELYRSLLKAVDPAQPLHTEIFREIWQQRQGAGKKASGKAAEPDRGNAPPSRGRTWFQMLTVGCEPIAGDVPSVRCADATLGGERVRYIAVVPDPDSRFPRARQGEVGLEEGWAIAEYIRQAMEADQAGERRAIAAIVDVPSQAYGYREELLGIHLACAAAVDAYATARELGHPVITLVVGHAISGAFLSHGMQANRILALDDEGVHVHVMSKQSAARITRRSVAELEEATKKVPAMAYDIRSFATLGALHELIGGVNADTPGDEDRALVQDKIAEAIKSTRFAPRDLHVRLSSEAASRGGRTASIQVRRMLAEQWR